MAHKRTEYTEREICGLKFFRPIMQVLARLRQLYPDPKRHLLYDDYIVLLLLYYFNPVMTSLRSLQRVSDFESIQKRLGIQHASLGSLSESARVFDSTPLRAIVADLVQQASAQVVPALPRPSGLPRELQLLAADGTLWSFLPRMAPWFWAAGPRTGPPPGFKALVVFNILQGIPVDASIESGYPSERRALEALLQEHAFYVMDRGFVDLSLYQTILDKGSSFLCFVRHTLVTRALDNREISAAARAAGVTSDQRVEVGSEPHRDKLRQPLRLIRARVLLQPPHNLNVKRRPQGEFIELVLLTDRFDVPAEDLVLLYKYRWHIEIFFRWLKCTLGCKHLLSHCQNGFELQFYVALIAGLLITLYTGKKPNKAVFEAIQLYLAGWISEDELLAKLNKAPPARP
jgi:hypothetical protein